MSYKSKTRQRNTKLNYECSVFSFLSQKFNRYIIVKDAEKYSLITRTSVVQTWTFNFYLWHVFQKYIHLM